MSDIPVTDGLVDRAQHGQQAARLAQGQTEDGKSVKMHVANADDAFSQGMKEYRVEIDGNAASVRVSEAGAVTSVGNQVGGRYGAVRGEVGVTAGNELAQVMQAAFADGRITPQELKGIVAEASDVIAQPSLQARVSQTRGTPSAER